jgi:cell wall-associated NlpC family hydrolase
MNGVEINIAPPLALQQYVRVKDAWRPSVKGIAARMVAVAFSGLVFVTASAHATTSDLDNTHVATGAVEVGEPELADGDAFHDGTHAAQEPVAESSPVAIEASNATLVEVLEEAQTMIGIPYLWGGNTPETGLDCSGFVRYVYEKAAGILLPRLSAQISRKGLAIAQSDLHPGDLVFFNTPRGEATHVGIYVGEHQFIHAPKKGTFIRVESMKSAYWTSRYYGARRVVV